MTDTRPRRDDKLASFVTGVRRSSCRWGRVYIFPSVLREVGVPISHSRLLSWSNIPSTIRLLSIRWKKRGEEEGERKTEAAVVHEEEEDEEVAEVRRQRGERGRTRTPTMRRRYATEYHYPDNGPAISSTACINLRVKGQDTRYLNK